MKRNILAAVTTLVALGAIWTGCLDRKPAPVCPVPIEIAQNEVTAAEFDGVDMLVVVDNSNSMAEEQEVLSSGFFSLINSLTTPIPTWDYAPVKNMHVAIVSSDLGLMYGPTHDTALSPNNKQTCDDQYLRGDDGQFKTIDTILAPFITVPSGVISCDETAAQCPPADPNPWTCGNIDATTGVGTCQAPGSDGTVNCYPLTGGNNFALMRGGTANNSTLSREVACMGQQGTKGCGFEQQLEAAVRGLEVNESNFIARSHLLAVIVVSDEEDCSINDPTLFQTDEWLGSGDMKGLVNVACNWHAGQMDNSKLFTTDRYYTEFVKMKEDMASAVIFAAIVGVPQNPTCEGLGNEIGGCLDAPEMQYVPANFVDYVSNPDGTPYVHFAPACVRPNPANPTVPITEARPGRRFVEVANLFGENGYVYSICNPDWSQAMEKIAAIIAKQISSSCYAKQLNWQRLPANKQPPECANGDCGVAECDVVVQFTMDVKEKDKCPDAFYAGLSAADKKMYESKITSAKIEGSGGGVTQKHVFCPLPKLPTPKACGAARETYTNNPVGWFYCEEDGENFKNACFDGKDNDGNGSIDADDEGCAGCYDNDTANDVTACDDKKCSYGVEITDAGKDVSSSNKITVQCLQQFSFEDQNCQEDSPATCYDTKDMIDEDGNGVYNCTSGDGVNTAHDPDPACCPMEVGAGNICEVDKAAVVRNCKNGMAKFMPEGSTNSNLQESDWLSVPACAAHRAKLGCTLPAK